MKSRLSQSGAIRSGMISLIMVMISFLACFYIAGRLWQDAEVRVHLSGPLQKTNGQRTGTLSIDDTLKRIDCKDKTKRLAELEIELSAARSQGYSARHPPISNATSNNRLHAVIGINTGFGQRSRRDSIRKTWMPTAGTALQKLEVNKGIIIRFVVGRSANKGDSIDQLIGVENDEMKDFLILSDHIEDVEALSRKTKAFFSIAVEKWDADFYVKVDDNVFVNVDKLGEMLATHWDKPRVYVGCMKSGEVFSDPKHKWYEPEWWKFGDKKSYFTHAEGQLFGISKALAQYISINGALLHTYRHEDVSVGAWFLGLNVEHVDERRLCCASRTNGAICETPRA
ncbi:hypothetical protein O6H91_16G022000 [Diphasiastrum complanatum]|uniref:Uncharacterized protein n=1 Tax=Diphasiastrum complanatum TaxID=34168 RepID=A0ACC2BAH2_DIPCM|nr:hypothetical protein O6H91_Y273600 [Diphasiastrum complanatum]KAJ7526760.1 hypothetical protein O6H91_16G022000 [Diphasiastrum complanatum]